MLLPSMVLPIRFVGAEVRAEKAFKVGGLSVADPDFIRLPTVALAASVKKPPKRFLGKRLVIEACAFSSR